MLQSKVILGFIIFIGFAAGYLYYSKTGEIFIDEGLAPLDSALEYFKNTDLDFSVLDDERYKSLEIYGEVPVNPGTVGRRNIFDPIQ